MSTEADRAERGPTSPARDGAQAAAKSPGLRRLAAAGLLGYAAIHLLVGWLAFSLAWLQASPGRGERPTDSSGALALVAQSPAGGAGPARCPRADRQDGGHRGVLRLAGLVRSRDRPGPRGGSDEPAADG